MSRRPPRCYESRWPVTLRPSIEFSRRTSTSPLSTAPQLPLNDSALKVPDYALAGVNVWTLREIAKLGNFTVEFYGAQFETKTKSETTFASLLSIGLGSCLALA